MKGFKDSTKTQYSMGGSCYAKGGAVKGAAKVSKVMGEFKSGALHSGSKKGPEVTNPKQAVAIALSEARKAGAKIPVKKAGGGSIEGDAVARGNRSQALEASEEAGLIAEGKRRAAAMAKRGNPYTKEPPAVRETRVVREVVPRAEMDAARRAAAKPTYRDTPLIGGLLGEIGDRFGFKKGGLAAMPKGKKR